MNTSVIKNVSSQGLEIILSVGAEYVHHWIKPKQSLSVPSTYLTDTVHELAARKLITIKNA